MILYFVLLTFWGVLGLTYQATQLSGPKLTTNIQKAEKRYAFWGIVPLILIMGLRGITVGNDTEQYKFRYDEAAEMLVSPYYQAEKGYNYLGFLCHDILSIDWQVYLILTSVFICFVLVKFIRKYSDDLFFSLFIHLSIGLFTMTMSGLRQSIAVSICLLALMLVGHGPKLSVKKLIFALLLVFGAYSIHNSAFIFFPVIFLTRIRLTKKQVLLLLVLAVSSLIFKELINSLALYVLPERYLDDKYSLNQNYKINYLVILVTIAIPLFCLFKSLTERDGKFSPQISTMYLFSALNILFVCLSTSNNQIGRLSYYYVCSYLSIIPFSVSNMKSDDKSTYKLLIMFFCLIYFIMGTMGGTLHIDEYKFFWE